MKNIIVAVDKNNGIGNGQDLLWGRDLPKDLALFKKKTIGTSVIMGRKTLESIGKALPNRQNIVISRQNASFQGVQVVHSLEEAYQTAIYPTLSIIGGGEIYQQTMKDADYIYVTEVNYTFPNATVFFPKIDKRLWTEVERKFYPADSKNLYNFNLITYKKY